MGRFLNFGAGPNQLPEPWENLNAAHDIRKRLRFDDGSASAILAEHVIEHVPFLQGYGFLRECFRVLDQGGILRLAFPDIGRLLTPRIYNASREFSAAGFTYARGVGLVRDPEKAAMLLLIGWQHQAAWTLDSACGSLLSIGFDAVRERQYGEGELAGIDGHHKAVSVDALCARGAQEEVARLETTIVEATK